MNYIKFSLDIIFFIIITYFFLTNLLERLKLHQLRLKMQELNIIESEINMKWITSISLFFWILPVNKFKELGDLNHNKKLKKINTKLLATFFSLFTYFLINTLLK